MPPPRPRPLRLPRADPLEKEIEARVVAFAKARGFYVRKFVSPAHRSVPDRLFISPQGEVFFMELKRQGQRATHQQQHEHQLIRATGTPVYVVDDARVGQFIVGLYLT